MAFFDHWLKGIDNGIMDQPPVRLEIRTGRGASYVQEEHEWPVARTEYVRWYLDASPADREGPAPAATTSCALAREVPGRAVGDLLGRGRISDRASAASARTGVGRSAPCSPGATFISEPMEEDTVLAGYSKLVLWVSSTSEDMDIFVVPAGARRGRTARSTSAARR